MSLGIVFNGSARGGTVGVTPRGTRAPLSPEPRRSRVGEENGDCFPQADGAGLTLPSVYKSGEFPLLTRIFTQAWFSNSAGWQCCVTRSWRIYWFFGLRNEGRKFCKCSVCSVFEETEGINTRFPQSPLNVYAFPHLLGQCTETYCI